MNPVTFGHGRLLVELGKSKALGRNGGDFDLHHILGDERRRHRSGSAGSDQ
jgi:hypothetical protein